MPGLSLSLILCSKGRAEELRRQAKLLRRLLDQAAFPDANLICAEDISGLNKAPRPVDEADLYIALDEAGLAMNDLRQKAVEASDHDILLFIDDGCIPGESWLERMLAPFLDDEVTAVGGGTLPQRGNTIASALSLLGQRRGGLPRLIASGAHESESTHLSITNLALRRSAVNNAGGFGSHRSDDGETQQLLAAMAGRKLFVPAALVESRNCGSFGEVWYRFVRRGSDEYRKNRKAGMSRGSALLSPTGRSWFWRLPLLAVIWALFGTGWAVLLLSAYYSVQVLQVYMANRQSSPLSEVEARRQECLKPEIMVLAPMVKLCMEFGRDAGRARAGVKEWLGR